MASITAPCFPSSQASPNPTTSATPRNTRSLATDLPRFRRIATSAPRPSGSSFLCRCQGPDAPPPGDESGQQRRRPWDSALRDAVKVAVKRWEDYVTSFRRSLERAADGAGEGERAGRVEKAGAEKVDGVGWDWERWKRHFGEVEEQERIASILRSQLNDAVYKEDYEDASKLKRAIADAEANDTVGSAIRHLNTAVLEERYRDAAFIRDHAGAGLVGWWAGVSEDSTDPYGRIIRITAEHGRYVARSYSSRQLASGRSGLPLFEVYFTMGNDGKYKQQAVYLKRKTENLRNNPKNFPKALDVEKPGPVSGSSEEKNEISVKEDADTVESDDDSDIADGVAGIQNVLQDMAPGVKLKVLKVVAPGKVDRKLISNVIEQIMEDDEEEDFDDNNDSDEDIELEIVESEDDLKIESDSEEIEISSVDGTVDNTEEQSDLSMKFVIGGIMQNLSIDVPSKDVVRIPAKLNKKGRFSFSFSLMQDDKMLELDDGQAPPDKATKRPNLRSADLIMSDLAKVIVSKEKIPLKVLKDVGELINLTVNRDRIPQPFNGTMFFNRIRMPTSSDPLSGLYISAHGMFSTEVLYLRHKFGQWQEDGGKATNLEFYEYVEALKLTGDPSVPAGQVAFRAKVGKRNQLPHKGIIPEEFGVVARYMGQGRLAEPGFRNPRWVDGELVILDGKYIRGGPVIGFVYWAPEYHFLMFFNRLRLQE